jgi:hypothetical protein
MTATALIIDQTSDKSWVLRPQEADEVLARIFRVRGVYRVYLPAALSPLWTFAEPNWQTTLLTWWAQTHSNT